MAPSNDLTAWQSLVLAELENNRKSVDSLHTKVEDVKDSIGEKVGCLRDEIRADIDNMFKNEIVPIKTAVASLRVKSGVWGALAGMIPILLIISIVLLRHKYPEAKVITDDIVGEFVPKASAATK